MATGLNEPIELRVLGIRVAFPLESPDDPNTTGDGRFDLRDTLTYFQANGHNFDSSPHNRSFFEAHFRALDRFWNTASNNRISLVWSVYPHAQDSVYELPKPMRYYGRQRPADSGVVFGLREFVHDAVFAASADPSIRFSNYEAVFIFHAGSDRQSDVATDTPDDLFSAFFRVGTLSLSRPTAAGVKADSLSEVIIMPETMIQDGRIAVMNAVMAHEFGHQLGLVDLYDTYNFSTQVGNFSLMDNNAADVGVQADVAGHTRIVFGALPVFPDAWSRYYLGFAEAETVTSAQNVSIWAAEEEELPPVNVQLWKVPISSTEYYLIENRLFDLDGDTSAALRLDSTTNVVLGPANPRSRELNREYDFLLPGSGLLIWHVDEGVAALDYVKSDDIPDNFLANTLQWDHKRRFLQLFEADGLAQLGSSGIFSFYTGSYYDYYFRPNNIALTATSNPPALSNSGGPSGIRITNISFLGKTMTCDVATSGTRPGFPIYAGMEPSEAGAPIVTDVAFSQVGGWGKPGDGSPDVFCGYRNYVLGTRADGTPLTGPDILDTALFYDTSAVVRTIRPVAIAAQGERWVSPPLIYNIDRETSVLIEVSRTGSVYVWQMIDRNGDSLFDLLFKRETSAPPSGPPILWDHAGATTLKDLFVPTSDLSYNTFNLIDGSQTSHSVTGVITGAAGRGPQETVITYQRESTWLASQTDHPDREINLGADSLLSPVLGDLDRDGHMDVVIVSVTGRLWVLSDTMTVPPGFPVEMGVHPSGSPVLADLDRDGYLDIIIPAGGQIHAIARNGSPLTNFPVAIGPVNAPDTDAVTPVVGDLGDVNVLGLLTGGEKRVLRAVAGDGRFLDAAERPIGGSITSSAAWAYDSVAHQAVVYARGTDGFLYSFDAPAPSAPIAAAIWPMSRHDAGQTATLPSTDWEPIRPDNVFFAPERAYVYPNPARDAAIVRYWLGANAAVSIRIYDLAGNLITQAPGPGAGGLYNEWTWSCAEVASGVYYARLDVTPQGGGGTQTVFCKMAVVQ
ncbi:MAG: T9SS type A sorting domain-containing protein [candidate division Zixibacteria bacterium]|nr:T9SS type A sorting domain-containing protein [candidate division Zixibacteria bacterium]